MRQQEDASYFASRAQQETAKVKAAIARGAHPAAVAAHGEMAARYQASAFVLQTMD
ncbi:hypothetical protein WG907_11250 [Sphingobium sp. AN558]|uniref:hypothetical protein n=1 Tax=Sphingobium sp. AN558 TaxID=3133442 RepID=UPI0030C04492